MPDRYIVQFTLHTNPSEDPVKYLNPPHSGIIYMGQKGKPYSAVRAKKEAV